MLRVRFHGRGGHGVKTASRIVGTAAFQAGLNAQDSPIYGAERRGAAVAAFTRIDAAPILERGVVTDPDLVVVADETLLDDSAAGVLSGIQFASGMLVNAARPATAIAGCYHVPGFVQSLDLTAITLEMLGRGSALSAALAAAAAAMTGLIPIQRVIDAVQVELADLHLPAEAIQRNIAVVERVYPAVRPVPLRRNPGESEPKVQAPQPLLGPEAIPAIHAAGNAVQRHTGSWRLFRPVIDQASCTRCSICFVQCPDSAITLDARSYPVIDYDNCKGCMICRMVCPVHCIAEEKEVRAW